MKQVETPKYSCIAQLLHDTCFSVYAEEGATARSASSVQSLRLGW